MCVFYVTTQLFKRLVDNLYHHILSIVLLGCVTYNIMVQVWTGFVLFEVEWSWSEIVSEMMNDDLVIAI